MYLICYDITHNGRRSRLAKKLLQEGFDRINKSVYLGNPDESSLKNLVQWLNIQMSKSSDAADSLIVIPLTIGQVQRMLVLGNNELDKDEITGNKSTLII